MLFIVSSILGQIPENAVSIEDAKFNDYFLNNTPPVVKGVVLNVSDAEIDSFQISYSIVTPFTQLQTKKTCSLNPDGTFKLILDYPFPYQQIWFRLEPFIYAGIYANTDLYIELDADKLRKRKVYMIGAGVKYLGEDGELNTYLNNHKLYKSGEKRRLKKSLKNHNLSNGFDSLHAQLVAIDDSYINEYPSKYSWLIKNERLSDYYGRICQMQAHSNKKMNEELLEEVIKHKVYLISNSGMLFYKYMFYIIKFMSEESDYGKFRDYSKLTEQQKSIIDSIVVIRKRNLNNPAPIWDKYCEYANNARSTFLNDTLLISNTTRCIRLLDSIFPSSKADMLKLKFTNKDPADRIIIQDVVMNNTQTGWCNKVKIKENEINQSKIKYINNSLKESELFISDNSIGTPILKMPFGAELFKVDTLSAMDLLSNIRNKYKGKALFMDIWATWCGPCLREMPSSNKLHSELNNDPIEFIYLCTSQGSSIEKWKSKIAELEIAGTHIFVKSVIQDELMSSFNASGYPSYIFIDQDGNYITGAIERPSNMNINKLKKLIND